MRSRAFAVSFLIHGTLGLIALLTIQPRPSHLGHELLYTAAIGRSHSAFAHRESATPGVGAPSREPAGPSESQTPTRNQPGELEKFGLSVRNRIEQHLEFPVSLRRRNLNRRLLLEIVLTSSGSIQEAQVKQSSGSEALDRLAIEAAKDASPFPGMPAAGQLIRMSLPIQFRGV